MYEGYWIKTDGSVMKIQGEHSIQGFLPQTGETEREKVLCKVLSKGWLRVRERRNFLSVQFQGSWWQLRQKLQQFVQSRQVNEELVISEIETGKVQRLTVKEVLK